MIANIEQLREGFKVRQNRKESGFYASYKGYAIDSKGITQFTDVRLYMPGRIGSSPQYCCVWINSQTQYGSGGGRASGYGYHKASAAMEAALRDAGIVLYCDDGTTIEYIGGVGDTAMNTAIKAIGVALGYDEKSFYIGYNHG